MLLNPVSFPISHVYRKNKSKLSHRDTYTHTKTPLHPPRKEKEKEKQMVKKKDSRFRNPHLLSCRAAAAAILLPL